MNEKETEHQLSHLEGQLNQVVKSVTNGITHNTKAIEIHTEGIKNLFTLFEKNSEIIDTIARRIKELDARLTLMEIRYEKETGQRAGENPRIGTMPIVHPDGCECGICTGEGASADEPF